MLGGYVLFYNFFKIRELLLDLLVEEEVGK